MTKTMPITAAEALEVYRSGLKYTVDGDPGDTPIEEVRQDAAKVVELAKAEGIALEVLVPDQVERDELVQFAAEHAAANVDWDSHFNTMGDVDWGERAVELSNRIWRERPKL